MAHRVITRSRGVSVGEDETIKPLVVTHEEMREWGIRLTQGMPTSCGRADPIPADYTACRGHLSEADTHLVGIRTSKTGSISNDPCLNWRK